MYISIDVDNVTVHIRRSGRPHDCYLLAVLLVRCQQHLPGLGGDPTYCWHPLSFRSISQTASSYNHCTATRVDRGTLLLLDFIIWIR